MSRSGKKQNNKRKLRGKKPYNNGNSKSTGEQLNVKPKVTELRLHGLYNQGQTCYLNSVLQVLFMTTEIHDRLDRGRPKDQQLGNIFEGLKKNKCETTTITDTFGIKNVNEQQDAAECLENILRKISPQASQVFHGKLLYTTTCSKGHVISVNANPFWSLPLSLNDTGDTCYSVKNGFDAFFQTQQFGGEDEAYCDTCEKKREAQSECQMESCPQVLTLLLKRFYFDYRTMSHVKENCCVDVPLKLQTKNKEYSLYGVVNHTGSLKGGHYTATILSTEDKTWYKFNDTHVEKVKQQPFAESGIYKSSTAYLLMYRGHEIDCSISSQRTTRQDKSSKSKMQLRSGEDIEAQNNSEEEEVSAPLNITSKMKKSNQLSNKNKGEAPQQTYKSSRGKCNTKDKVFFFILLVSILSLAIIVLVIFLKFVHI